MEELCEESGVEVIACSASKDDNKLSNKTGCLTEFALLFLHLKFILHLKYSKNILLL